MECVPPPLRSEGTTLECDVAAQEAGGGFLAFKINTLYDYIHLSLHWQAACRGSESTADWQKKKHEEDDTKGRIA